MKKITAIKNNFFENKYVRWSTFNLLPFLCVYILLLYPVILAPRSVIYGIGHDNLAGIRNPWMIQQALWHGASLKEFTLMNFPTGVNFWPTIFFPSASSLLNFLMAVFFPNPILGYNVQIFLKWFLCFYFMLKFLMLLTKDNYWAALYGAIFYSFSPYFQLQTMAYGPPFIPAFCPMFLYFIGRYFSTPTWKSLVYLCGAGILFFTDNFYFSCFGVFVLLLVLPIYTLSFPTRVWKISKRILFDRKLATLIALSVCGGGILYLLLQSKFGLSDRIFSPIDSLARGGRNYDLFDTPQLYNWTYVLEYYDRFLKIAPPLEIYEATFYLGRVAGHFAFAFLVVLFFLPPQKRPPVSLCIFIGLTAAVMSMGAGHHLQYDFELGSGRTLFAIDAVVTPPTGYIYKYIAPMFRFVARYHFVTLTAFMIFVTMALNQVMAWIPWRPVKYLLVAGMMLATASDYFCKPGAVTTDLQKKLPAIYNELNALPEKGAIIEVSKHELAVEAYYEVFQVFHQRPRKFFYQESDIQKLLNEDAQLNLYNQGFRYIVVHKKLTGMYQNPLQYSSEWTDFGYKTFPEKDVHHLKLLKSTDDALLFALTRT